MQKLRKPGLGGVALAALCLAVLSAAPAAALDFNDVQNLLRNQVPDNVIINMAQQDSSLAITPDQANQLRSLGASESVIAAIRPAASAVAAAPQSYPVTVDSGYATTTTAPSSGLSYGYDSSGNVVYYDQATGRVHSTVPQTSTTYVSPDVTYYEPSAPVVVASSPTVIYETPTIVTSPSYYGYSRSPSWGFSVGFGSGWGDRRWGGYRPYHRPPPPPGRFPGGRPGGPPRPPRPPRR